MSKVEQSLVAVRFIYRSCLSILWQRRAVKTVVVSLSLCLCLFLVVVEYSAASIYTCAAAAAAAAVSIGRRRCVILMPIASKVQSWQASAFACGEWSA